jgi:hypothetical protein
MNNIEELKAIALSARAKKGRMDAQERARAAEILASVWRDVETNPDHILRLMDALHYEALAQGIGAAWTDMSPEKRQVFQQWLPAPTTERDTRRLAFVAAAILEKDSSTVMDWLDRIISSGRGHMNKEVRHILATTILAGKVNGLRNITRDETHLEKTLRVLAALLEVGQDKEEKVTVGVRYELVDNVLHLLDNRKIQNQTDTLKLLNRVEDEIKSWPKELKEQFRQRVTGIPTELLDRFFVQASAAPPASVGQESQAMSAVMAPPQANNYKDALDLIDGRIAELQKESVMLSSVRTMLMELENEVRLGEEARKQAATVERRLQTELSDSTEQRRRLEEKVRELVSQHGALQRELEIIRSSSETQRTELLHQIDANSRGRIEEYKISLGLTLSKLVQDLPAQTKELSPAAARVLLLQFHQFLEMLEEKGIRVRPAKGTGA